MISLLSSGPSMWQQPRQFLSCLMLLLCMPAPSALAFNIVAPANGAILTSGQPTTVEVEAGKEAGLVEVRYYWYPEQTDALVEQGKIERARPLKAPWQPISIGRKTVSPEHRWWPYRC